MVGVNGTAGSVRKQPGAPSSCSSTESSSEQASHSLGTPLIVYRRFTITIDATPGTGKVGRLDPSRTVPAGVRGGAGSVYLRRCPSDPPFSVPADMRSVALILSLLALLTLLPGGIHAQSGATAGPVFVDGQAQVVPAFADTATWIREELWVETEFDSDGDGAPDRVHVAVVRPGPTAEGLKVPVIYESSPYFSGTAGATDFFWSVNQELGAPPAPRGEAPSVRTRVRPGISGSLTGTWVPRGFAVVHSEAPGTGLSQGCPTVGGPVESLAPKAVIDWLNGRAKGYTAPIGGTEVVADWTTGRVGMTGTSYNGTIPVAAATTGVEGLEAIIPIAPNTSYYQYYRSNGLVRNPGGYPGEDVDMLYDYVNSGDPARRDWCTANVRDAILIAGQDRATGDYNDFWATRDLWNEIDGIQAATLMAHAFNDWNVVPVHSVHVAERLKERGVPLQQYYHQGGHGGAPPMELMNRWFTRYLWEVENGVENDPGAWIVREDSPRDEPTPYADYPNPDATRVQLFPQAGGISGALGLGQGEGQELLVDNAEVEAETLARETSAALHRRLYLTPVLAEPLHISGTPRVTVRMASSEAAANLSVWLVQLPWAEPAEGERASPTANLVTRGWADPQNRNSRTESEPLVPGEFVEVSFDLQPDDQIIPAGRQLGLMIFSSERGFTLLPEAGTEISIDLAGTRIELPVVGGRGAFERAVGR